MVDVSVPAPQLELSTAPQISIDPSVFQRNPRRDAGLGELANGMEDLAVPLAKDAAQDQIQKGVTLDANGDPQVGSPDNSVIFGRAGAEYTAAVQQGTVAAQRAAVTDHLNTLHQQFPTDVASYNAAASTYIDGLRKSDIFGPTVANALADEAQNISSQHANNIAERSIGIDVNNAKTNLETTIGTTTSKMSAMARQGLMSTPEYDQLQDQLQDTYDALKENKLYGYSPEKADSDLQSTMDGFKADYVVGQVDQAFTKKDKGSAQKLLEDGILNNPDLQLTDAERQHYYTMGMARLQFLSGEQKAQIDANRVTLDATVDAIHKDPASIPAAVSSQVIAQAESLGDAEGAAKVRAAVLMGGFTKSTAGLTDEQKLNVAMGGGAGGGDYITKAGIKENNTGNPNAGNGGGPFQFTPDTWATLMRTHPELGLTADGRNDPAQGQRAMVAFTNDNRAYLQSHGIAPTDQNTYMAHFLGAAGATSFIQAMNANPNAPAAANNLRAATANPSVFYKPGADGKPDLTQPRTLAEVYQYQTHTFGAGTSPVASSPNGLPFTPDQLKSNPFLMSEYVRKLSQDSATADAVGKSVGAGLITQVKAGITPDQTTLANYFQLAARNPEKFQEQSQELKAAMVGGNIAASAGQSSAGAGQALIDDAHNQAANDHDIFHLQVANAAQTAFTKGQTELKNNPNEEGVRRGWLQRAPIPLDFTPPADGQASTLPQAIAERSQAAITMGSRMGTQQPIFSPNELKQLQSSMPAVDGGTASTVLSALNNLPAAQLDQLNEDKDFKSTIMGMAHSGDPVKMTAAYGFLDAQYRRNPAAFDASDGGALKDLRTWQALSSFLPPAEAVKRMMQASDPSQIAAREAADKQADKNLQGVSASNVVSAVYGAHVPLIGLTVPFTSPGAIASESPGAANGAFMAEYTDFYKDMFRQTGDHASADAYAKEKLANKYSTSDMNGGRLMAYAPDREIVGGPGDGTGAFYPKVNGSFDYLKNQLRIDMQQTDFFQNLRQSGTSSGFNESARIARGLDYQLVSDDKTQADIAAKRPPSYHVIATNPDTGRTEAIQASDGTLMRWRGDPDAARAEAASDFAKRRELDRANAAEPDPPIPMN